MSSYVHQQFLLKTGEKALYECVFERQVKASGKHCDNSPDIMGMLLPKQGMGNWGNESGSFRSTTTRQAPRRNVIICG